MTAYTGAVPDTRRTPDWRAKAVCKGDDTDTWFPQAANTLGVLAAKEACFGCPVMLACAQHALTHRIDDGVWGGLSEAQRTKIHGQYRDAALTDPATVRTAVLHVLRDELNPVQSLRDLWEERTHPLPGGHIGWQGDSGSFSFKGRSYTPGQLAFLLDRGYKAKGITRRTCEVVGCVNPRHLADNAERYQQRKQAEETAARAALAAEVAAELAAVKVPA